MMNYYYFSFDPMTTPCTSGTALLMDRDPLVQANLAWRLQNTTPQTLTDPIGTANQAWDTGKRIVLHNI